jgi:hypothetical protein
MIAAGWWSKLEHVLLIFNLRWAQDPNLAEYQFYLSYELIHTENAVLFSGRNFYIRHSVQIGSGVQPDYQMGTEIPFMWYGEALDDHSDLFRAGDKNVWLYTSNPTRVFGACAELRTTTALPLKRETGINVGK